MALRNEQASSHDVATSTAAVRAACAQATMGVAVFVKTPGLSPLKTRLAAGVGRQAAESFYLRSLEVIQAQLQAQLQAQSAELSSRPDSNVPLKSPLQCYWAVAEAQAKDHALWQQHPVLAQGQGGLGERIARVYEQLQGRHDIAVLLGADLPDLPPDLLKRVAACLSKKYVRECDYVIGPAQDGGFYAFASRRQLGPEVWMGVPYSQPSTLSALLAALPPGRVSYLPPRRDVDTQADLYALADRWPGVRRAYPEQKGVQAFQELEQQLMEARSKND